MFDFFVEIEKNSDPHLMDRMIFDKRKEYQELVYSTKFIDIVNGRLIALSKNEKDGSVLDHNDYTVFIYGYCFTRLEGEIKEKKRLFAKEILDIFLDKGKEITSLIKGSYSILIYNKKLNSLNLFTDELNLRNVYYADIDDKLILSSSLSAFKAYSEIEFSKVNLKSVIEYSLFDFDLNNETFIEKVKTVPPGHHLSYYEGILKVNQYWNIFKEFESVKPVLKSEEAINKVDRLLKDNLSLYLSGSDGTAFALTGGYDSRTNLALLNGKFDNGYYFSYGREENYDIKVARMVADKLKLNYNPFILENNFEDTFDKNAIRAIDFGDGIAEMNRANYVYVFKKMSKQFNYILTGLFGSELIKRPTSLGGYINKNVKSVLLSQNISKTFEEIITDAKKKAFISPELIEKYKDEIYLNLEKNPYLNNDYKGALKFFFYTTGKGILKYFMKEIKVERPYITNLHPYLDIEFIYLLMKTPFPWLYNWDTRKSQWENLKIHKFYALLINRNNKKLANIISTHAYKPKYLLRKIYLPLLIVQYFYYRRKIKKIGDFTNKKLIWNFYKHRRELLDLDSVFNNNLIKQNYKKHIMEFSKLVSLQVWLKKNNLKY